jgi:hypothetical protein
MMRPPTPPCFQEFVRLPGLFERKGPRNPEGEHTVVDELRRFGEPVPVGEDLLYEDARATDGRRGEGGDERDESARATDCLMGGDAEDGGVDHGVHAAGDDSAYGGTEIVRRGDDLRRAEGPYPVGVVRAAPSRPSTPPGHATTPPSSLTLVRTRRDPADALRRRRKDQQSP